MSQVETKEVVALVISDDITKLAEQVGAELTIDGEGNFTAPDDIFDRLVTDVTPDEVVRVQKALTRFGTASFKAVCEKGVDTTHADKAIKRVSGVIKTGLDEIAINYNRPSGNKSDGSVKDPAVSLITRRHEHADHAAVRQTIYARARSLID